MFLKLLSDFAMALETFEIGRARGNSVTLCASARTVEAVVSLRQRPGGDLGRYRRHKHSKESQRENAAKENPAN